MSAGPAERAHHLERLHEIHVVHRNEWDQCTDRARYRRVYQNVTTTFGQWDLGDAAVRVIKR